MHIFGQFLMTFNFSKRVIYVYRYLFTFRFLCNNILISLHVCCDMNIWYIYIIFCFWLILELCSLDWSCQYESSTKAAIFSLEEIWNWRTDNVWWAIKSMWIYCLCKTTYQSFLIWKIYLSILWFVFLTYIYCIFKHIYMYKII